MEQYEQISNELSIIFKYIQIENLKISEGNGDEIYLLQLKIKYYETCGKLASIKL